MECSFIKRPQVLPRNCRQGFSQTIGTDQSMPDPFSTQKIGCARSITDRDESATA